MNMDALVSRMVTLDLQAMLAWIMLEWVEQYRGVEHEEKVRRDV